jgi:hypothetical protein
MKLHPKNLEVFEITIEQFKYSNFSEEPLILEGTGNELNRTFRTDEYSRDLSSPHRPHFFPHLRRR